MRWGDVDHTDVWTIPADVFKGKRAHAVPFCDEALQILKELPLIDDVYEPTRRYLRATTTGSIGQGIAWLNIPVLNARHAELLGIDFGYRYERDDVVSGLRQVLAAEEDDGQRARVAAFRDARLAASAEVFADWVHA